MTEPRPVGRDRRLLLARLRQGLSHGPASAWGFIGRPTTELYELPVARLGKLTDGSRALAAAVVAHRALGDLEQARDVAVGAAFTNQACDRHTILPCELGHAPNPSLPTGPAQCQRGHRPGRCVNLGVALARFCGVALHPVDDPRIVADTLSPRTDDPHTRFSSDTESKSR